MLSKGEKIDLFVTNVEFCGGVVQLWAQVDQDGSQNLETLMSAVEENPSTRGTTPTQGSLDCGDVCLALYKEDGKWYESWLLVFYGQNMPLVHYSIFMNAT